MEYPRREVGGCLRLSDGSLIVIEQFKLSDLLPKLGTQVAQLGVADVESKLEVQGL